MSTSNDRSFSANTRAENIERLAHEHFDVAIIGGGINGTAAARDAALRGYRVALIEKDDFASGTSSRSSRLAHGGLRYLERYHFGLVNESVIERARLLRHARRLVEPLAFIYPVYRGRYPRYSLLNLALWVYDVMSIRGGRGSPLHRMLRTPQLEQMEPLIVKSDVVGAGRYYDATVNDARLTMFNAKAAHDAGAIVANYVEACALLKAGTKLRGMQARDALNGREFEIQARVVVNATGPWVDDVARMDAPDQRGMLRTTKGAHLIVPRQILPVNDAVVLRTPQDNRVMFVIPWGQTSIIGTTDTDYTQAPEQVTADRHDTTYLLEAVNQLMPKAQVSESDVISAYAGVRPLVAAAGSHPSAVSREHVIAESTSGLLTIAGGKLTTHRAMAEQLVDRVQTKLMRDFGVAPRAHSRTADLQLVESIELDLPDAPPDIAAHLVHTYGADTFEILRLCQEDVSLLTRVVEGLPYIRAEALYATQHEMCVTLNDFLIRRTHVVYESPDGGLLQAGRLAADMGALLGWSDVRMEHEVARYEQQVNQTRRFRY